MNNNMIFFDIDVTLLDHKGAELKGIKIFYKKNGFETMSDFENFRNVWVRCSDRNFDKFLKKECTFEEQRAMRIIDVFKEFGKEIYYEEALGKFSDYLVAYEDSWSAYDDVIPCLTQLKNYRLGVISNGDYEQQVNKLKKIGIYEYFENVIAAGEVGVAKPDAKIFEIACEKNGVDVESSWYIGDNIKTDILPCNMIGMKSILINRECKANIEEGITQVYSLTDILSKL